MCVINVPHKYKEKKIVYQMNLAVKSIFFLMMNNNWFLHHVEEDTQVVYLVTVWWDSR